MINRKSYFNKFEKFILFIKIDEGCNMRCSFCYQNIQGKKDRIDETNISLCLENVKFAIDRYLKIRPEYSVLTVCFFGGEPTLNPLAIHQICDFIKANYGKEQLKNIRFSITTNGTNYNDEVVEALKKMKSVSINPVTMMISSDNNKEIYDKNRKLLNGNSSAFEIVNENILKFKELLNTLNKYPSEEYIKVSAVLATEEQIAKSRELIQENYKAIYRGEKFLYGTNEVSPEYINQSKAYLFNLYNRIVDEDPSNKDEYIDIVTDVVFSIQDRETGYGECRSLVTIYGDGTFGWCNKHKHFENEVLSQEKMRELVFNLDADNSHFECVKAKIKRGSETKDEIRKDGKLWQKFISNYTLAYHLDGLNVFCKENDNVYNFIKYGLLGTNGDKVLYIENPSERIVNLCKEHNVNLSSIPITKEGIAIISYIDEDENIYLDDTSIAPVSSLKDKYFLFYNTPILIESINLKFNHVLRRIANEEYND